MLDYGIPNAQGLSLFDILIRTMRDAKLKEKALRAHVKYWEDHLFQVT
jgi:hypothetical protein